MQEYINSNESLDAIVQRCFNHDQYLEAVFANLTKEIHQEKISHELLNDIDKALINGHPDTSLYLLFIAIAVAYNNLHFQFVKAHSLCSIALSLNQEEILPIVRALFLQHQSNLYRKEGNINECMRLMEESTKLVDKNNPRYVVILNNSFFMVALQGKLKVNGAYLLDQLHWSSDRDKKIYPIELKIENAIVTGNFHEGFDLIEEYQKYSNEELPYRFKFSFNTLKILSSDFKESNYEEKAFKYLAKSYQALALGKFEEARKWHDDLHSEKLKRPRLNEYLLLHVEICQGNKGMAKLILQEKVQKGDVHYLDDLFYGRLQLLDNDVKGADLSFAKLIENVNRYGAIPRLNFELQFAKEMKLPIILQLINGWKPIVRNSLASENKEEIKSPIPIEKGVKLLVGKSKLINQVKDLVKKYAKLKAPILVTGETGTGKELVSRAIHDEGPNPDEPFIAINCGALTDTLLQSELFGYEAGAFTDAQKQRQGIFEAAGKGTVFLDEFGDISPKLQVSLLRVLEANEIRMIGSSVTRKINCKIVIATNVDLHGAVVDKKFREDLFFRLARFEIKLPSLKERLEDLPELIQYFLNKNSSVKGSKKISRELEDKLLEYRWPGNIRELKNEIDRLFILNPDIDILSLAQFDFTHLQKKPEEGLILTKDKPVYRPTNAKHNIEDRVLKVIQKGFPVEKRHALFKEIFLKHKKLSRSQIMEIANISTTTATKDLQILADIGFIVRRKPTKSSRTDYFELVDQNEKAENKRTPS